MATFDWAAKSLFPTFVIRRCFTILLFWVISYFMLLPAFGAGTPSATGETRYRLQGTVINSVTGQPISRVLVQVGEPVQQSLLTGPDGAFSFEDVLSGQTTLKARKPGFLDTEAGKPVWSRPVEIGPNTRPITIQLVSESTIEGHVETGDEPGSPVRANYQVLHARIEAGRRKLEQVAHGYSDDYGNFRVADLPSGSYYVIVQPNWAARPRSPSNNPRIEDDIFRSSTALLLAPTIRGGVIGGVAGPGDITGPGPSHWTISSPFYFPSSLNSAASPIILVPGKRELLKFPVKRQTTYTLSGKISGGVGGYVNIKVFDEFGQDLLEYPAGAPSSGEFIATLPAGKYILRAYRFAPPAPSPMLKPPELISEVPVTVNSDIHDFPMSLDVTRTIPVDVRTAFTGKSPATKPYANFQWVTVKLHALDAYHQDEPFQRLFNVTVTDPPKIRDVAPGRYAVEMVPNEENIYVSSARCGSMDLLREELVVPAAGPLSQIEIVVRDDGGVIAGTMKGHTSSSAKLLIVPQFAPRQFPIIANMDEHGGFRSPALAPGDYKILGFDSLKDVEYANPKVLDGYRAQAVHVKVLPPWKRQYHSTGQ